MITEEIKDLVKSEAKNLKKFASAEELSKLNIQFLRPSSSTSCIYGQLTGYCFNERAIELIHQCCKKVIVADYDKEIFECDKINGSPKDEIRYKYWSPIEVFISAGTDEQKSNLVSYLKGESNSLNI